MTNSNGSHEPSINGSMSLGLVLGQLQAQSAQTTAILSDMRLLLEALPDRMVETMKTAQPPAAPGVAIDWNKMADSLKEVLKAAAPLAFLAAVITKKIAAPDWPTIARIVFGGA